MREFTIEHHFSVSAEKVYDTWMTSKGHSEMTGGAANIEPVQGERFYAWDGYIMGSNESLIPGKLIRQTWRTTEFGDNDESSVLEINLESTGDGCKMTLSHSNIPEDQPDYHQGWYDHYIHPMENYFSKA